ncbi:MAG: hypothetical protein NXI24_00140 [bacterium]|nr:hypothetical protein [bacterium]
MSASDKNSSGTLADAREEQQARRMRRFFRIAFYSFVVISGFYLLSGTLGMLLAGLEMAGPPPEAEVPVMPPVARLLGSLLVIALGMPGVFALFKRRSPNVSRFLKIGGIAILILHTLLAASSLEAPRGITIFLLLMAIMGMWITLVAFHPRTPALIAERAGQSAAG